MLGRLVIRGRLLVPDSLHIGSGESSKISDAPIRRSMKNQPYIPGSTLGGLLRATALDFAPYFFDSWECAIDKLFGYAKGTKGKSSRIIFDDALLTTDLPSALEVREHVGMDRQKGVARPHLQYNHEVTPSNTSYDFEINIEDPTETETQLILAILDFWSKFDFALHIGGRTTTGIGKAKIDKSLLEFYNIDFSDIDVLREYLLKPPINGKEFIPEKARIKRSDIETNTPKIRNRKEPIPEAFVPQHIFLTMELAPQEPILIQSPMPSIEENASDAEFVTALSINGERPYIPGSSLKGILRTRAEKIIRTVNFHRNNPDASTDQGYKSAQTEYESCICACAITHSERRSSFPEPDKLLACFGTPEKQRKAEILSKSCSYAEDLYDKSCPTCRMFGNSMMRGRINFSDAELVAICEKKLFDHVAIDRFHGGAEDKHKFDTRPMMPKANCSDPKQFLPIFRLNIHLERPEPWMLGLLGHLLKDMKTADIRIGSNIHRGYGKVGGCITKAEMLVLPKSELENLCIDNGLIVKGQNGFRHLGPYSLVNLDLPLLFGQCQWTTEGLTVDTSNPTVKLLESCHHQFQKLVNLEEGKPHGSF